MSFTRQDSLTFLIGLGAAILVTIGEALIRAEELADDPGKWASAVAVGACAAAGRYLVTELTRRGLTRTERDRVEELENK